MRIRTPIVAATLAAGLASGLASAVTPVGNVSNKGSVLVYQKIDVSGGNDTLISLTNDSSGAVRLRCFYAASDDLGTPYAGTAASAQAAKHFTSFTVDLTRNQPIAWWASTGRVDGDSFRAAGAIVPPFGWFANDGSYRPTGMLACWAVDDAQVAEQHWNHLFGTAAVINWGSGQAYEYTAAAFQALGPSTLTGTSLGTPGAINLDNVEYDACPNMLLGNFKPGGRTVVDASAVDISPRTRVTLASCNQDVRQAYTPTITKLTWTFWNQDEQQRTGTHTCANSWFETDFPSSMLNAQYLMLGTEAAYFRIESIADTQICGPSAERSSSTGVIWHGNGAGHFRSTNLVGRGVGAPAVIRWDPDVVDDYKK